MKLTIHVDGAIFSRQPHGGISRVFIELLKAWRRREDVNTHLYLEPNVDARTYRPMVDTIEWLPSRHLRKGERFLGPIYDILRNAAIRRAWVKAKSGVFISTYYTSPAGVAIPRVLLLQDMIYESYPAYFARPKDLRHREDKAQCFREATAVITPSISAHDEAVRIYGACHLPCRVIPYAVAACFLADAPPGSAAGLPEPLRGGAAYVLFMGSRSAHKNFDGLLHAFARAGLGESVHLWAVGGGPANTSERSMLEKLSLQNRVHFGGSLPDHELAAVVSSAKAVAVPSLCEGYGFPVIEAMAAGRPVASSTGGSLPEVGCDVPVYFDPHNLDAMAKALREVVSMPDDDPRLEKGRTIAHSRSWDDVAAEYVAFFHEVIDAS